MRYLPNSPAERAAMIEKRRTTYHSTLLLHRVCFSASC
jgi:hypothetical protein